MFRLYLKPEKMVFEVYSGLQFLSLLLDPSGLGKVYQGEQNQEGFEMRQVCK